MINEKGIRIAIEGCLKEKGPVKKVLVALSGGADSLFLTYMLCRYRDRWAKDLEIMAVTIDHKYRAESTEEAYEIGKRVKPWGVRHTVETMRYGDRRVDDIKNFEEVARTKRYAMLEHVCRAYGIRDLFLGHNLDDCIETYLQRLQMNSSVFGLVGLKPRSLMPTPIGELRGQNGYISILRPLLNYRKREIVSSCQNYGIRWFEDRTNADVNLTTRNFLRHVIGDVVPNRLLDPTLSDVEKKEMRLISFEALEQTYRKVIDYCTLAQVGIGNLRERLQKHIFYDERNLSLSLAFDQYAVEEFSHIVISRFLYQMLYPLSASKYYYWSYAKLERQAVPRILDFYSKNKGSLQKLKLTYLNISFLVRTDKNQNLLIEMSRQPIMKNDLPSLIKEVHLSDQGEWSRWLLFDNRYWLGFRLRLSPGAHIIIMPFAYNNAHHRRLIKIIREKSENLVMPKYLEGIPIIYEKNTHAPIALPTLDIEFFPKPVECRWDVKENVYNSSV